MKNFLLNVTLKKALGALAIAVLLSLTAYITRDTGSSISFSGSLGTVDGKILNSTSEKSSTINIPGSSVGLSPILGESIDGAGVSGVSSSSSVNVPGETAVLDIDYPPTITQLNSALQSEDGDGRVMINLTVEDLDEIQSGIWLRIEYETDHDGLCNGPWGLAKIAGPIGSTEGNAALLSEVYQAEKDGYQIYNISIEQKESGGQSKVSFIWDTKMNAPKADPQVQECLQIKTRDVSVDGVNHLFSVEVDNTAPTGPGFLIEPIIDLAINDTSVNIAGSCGADASNGTVKVVTTPVNGFINSYNESVDLDSSGQFKIENPEWLDGEYGLNFECTDAWENGPADLGSFGKVIIDTVIPAAVGAPPPVCGNGALEQGEQCDDGNTVTEACQLGLVGCSVCSSSCEFAPGSASFCGDSIIQANNGEECDDGNLFSGDSCSSTCLVEQSPIYNSPSPVVSGGGGNGGGQTVSYIANLNNASSQANESITVGETPVEGGISPTGAVYFSAGKNLQRNEPCLRYNPLRDLNFVDIAIQDVGAKEANILKNSFLPAGGGYEQYILSGYNTQAATQGESLVGLENSVTRLEWAKTLMISHCFDIIDFSSLPNARHNGSPMPSFSDLPLNSPNSWEKDIVMSAVYYGILDGTKENSIEFARPVTLAESIKMLVRAGEFRQGYQTRRADNLAAGRLSTNEWYFAFYSKAEQENLLTTLDAYRPGTILIRSEGVKLLLDALLTRDAYLEEDEAVVNDLK